MTGLLLKGSRQMTLQTHLCICSVFNIPTLKAAGMRTVISAAVVARSTDIAFRVAGLA
jgi:hypothetical protein